MSQLLVGPYLANLMLLVLAAMGKLLHPEAFAAAIARVGALGGRSRRFRIGIARGAALLELGAVAGALVVGPLPVLLADLGIAATALVLARRAPGAGCGCFGAASDAPVGGRHIAITLAMVGVASLAVAFPPTVATATSDGPLALLTAILLSACTSWLAVVVLAHRPGGVVS